MARPLFWNRWLQTVSVFLILGGTALAVLNRIPLFDTLLNNRTDRLFWPDGTAGFDVVPFRAWLYGVLGSVIAGWGMFTLHIARYPFAERKLWARNCLFTGVTLWYLIDTAVSLRYGVWFNAIFNTCIAALFYIPIVATRGEFVE